MAHTALPTLLPSGRFGSAPCLRRRATVCRVHRESLCKSDIHSACVVVDMAETRDSLAKTHTMLVVEIPAKLQ